MKPMLPRTNWHAAPQQILTVEDTVEDVVAAVEADVATAVVAAGMFPAASIGHPPTVIPAASWGGNINFTLSET